MAEKQKKGKFAGWKFRDWCVYAVFILLCFLFLCAAWDFIKAGRYLTGALLAFGFIFFLFLCVLPLFSKPVQESKSEYTLVQIPLPETKENFLELVKSIGGNEKDILAEVSECLTEPERFIEKAEKAAKESGRREDRDLYEDISAEYEEFKDYRKSADEPFLQGALILLEYRKLIARFDWKAEREDVLYFIENLRMVRTNGLPVDEAVFRKSLAVEQILSQLNTLWEKEGYRTVQIDNGSDEYIIAVQKY